MTKRSAANENIKPAAKKTPPPHQLQQEPPEGSREVIEGELRRQSGKKGRGASDPDSGKSEHEDPAKTASRTAGLP